MTSDQPTRADESRTRSDVLPKVGNRYAPGVADVLFLLFTVCILQNASTTMMDDPGLGWHLRIGELIWQRGGFLYTDELTVLSEGKPWVTQAWLADVALFLMYEWGELNGVAVFTALVIASALRYLFVAMVARGVNWLGAAFWAYLAALGTSVSWTARPNIFTLLGLVLVAQICERYYRREMPLRSTIILLPIFAIWTNLHGGFLAGVVVLLSAWGVLGLRAFDLYWKVRDRQALRAFRRFSMVVVAAIACTLINPYGIGLHLWNYQILTDPFVQTRTTTEWLPPQFTDAGWFRIEVLILALPILAGVSRARLSLLELVLNIMWLHFALTSKRYCALWVLVAVPHLAFLSAHVPMIVRLWDRGVRRLSADVQAIVATQPTRRTAGWSFVVGCVLLIVSPWLGDLAKYNEVRVPTAALNKLLTIYEGERVFHSANWGGYLSWYGRNLAPPFKNWIDDRLDVHGPELVQEYRTILETRRGWKELLEGRGFELLCIPVDSPLAIRIADEGGWNEVYRGPQAVIFRKDANRDSIEGFAFGDRERKGKDTAAPVMRYGTPPAGSSPGIPKV